MTKISILKCTSTLFLAFALFQLSKANQVLNLNNHATASDVKEIDRTSFSVPGTKWCGPGNTASNFDDLGKFMETDKCCRSHDNCDNIASGETKHGLTNNDPFTVLHCDCDKAFYDCLMKSDDEAAPVIGENYFLLRSRCYREDHPIKSCTDYDRVLIFRRCVNYEVDSSQPKRYQWFNLPFYSGKPFPNFARRSDFGGDVNTIDDTHKEDD